MDDNIRFQLGENPTLLNLYGYYIDAEAAAEIARALAQNTIKEMYMSDNEISDEGAAAIAGALEHDSTIITVYLSDNEIGAEGAAAIAGALETNSTITRVELLGNGIGSSLKKRIKDKCDFNKSQAERWEENKDLVMWFVIMREEYELEYENTLVSRAGV